MIGKNSNNNKLDLKLKNINYTQCVLTYTQVGRQILWV